MEDRIVIEDGGMRYVFIERDGCEGCVIGGECQSNHERIFDICSKFTPQMICKSCAPITPEPKMYFAWNREEARHLVGKYVEFHNGFIDGEWCHGTLLKVNDNDYPFDAGDRQFFFAIREIQKTQMTLSEAIAKYVPDDVEIVEDNDK